MSIEPDTKCIERTDAEYLPDTTEYNIKDIQHIVISGGGTLGFTFYGILREANQYGLWNIEHISTLYGTSIGSVLSTILCLRYDWNVLDDYFIKRPWAKVFHYDIQKLFDCVQNIGIFDKEVTEQMLSPLLLGKDILPTVTMLEYFHKTKIELHIIVTNINNFELVDISYKTHPTWKLVDAVHASCAIPIIYKPINIDGIFYCEGGFCSNYPIDLCIKNGAKPENIMGIKPLRVNNEACNIEMSSLFDYVTILMNNILKKVIVDTCINIKYTFEVPTNARSLIDISNVAENRVVREELIQTGRNYFYAQYQTMQSNDGTPISNEVFT